jgi:nucleotide-binding universal stress UspA family protein
MPSASESLFPDLDVEILLCWVGSAEEADPVAAVAQALAANLGATCQMIMGLASPFGSSRTSGQGSADLEPLTPGAIATTQRRLAALYGRELQPIVVPGNPVVEVRRYAAVHRVDLVVMGEQAMHVEQECGQRLADNAPCMVLILVPASQPTRNHG